MKDESASQAVHVIHKLGGINATARLLGHANPTTVQGWKQRGFVPAHRQADVLAKAMAAGIDLRADDFIVHLRALERPLRAVV